MRPLEALSAALLVVIVVLLLTGVVARYVFTLPVVWIDEIVSLSFLWLAMLGSVIAMHRNEHLRLSMFVDRMSPRVRGLVHAFALAAIAAFLMGLIVSVGGFWGNTEFSYVIAFLFFIVTIFVRPRGLFAR